MKTALCLALLAINCRREPTTSTANTGSATPPDGRSTSGSTVESAPDSPVLGKLRTALRAAESVLTVATTAKVTTAPELCAIGRDAITKVRALVFVQDLHPAPKLKWIEQAAALTRELNEFEDHCGEGSLANPVAINAALAVLRDYIQKLDALLQE